MQRMLKTNFLLIICGHLITVSSLEERPIGCQQKSTSGRTYFGEVNTTVKGIPCQRWSEKKPHDHPYSFVGDHNFCRNPYNVYNASQVWCFTTDPEVPFDYCSVPFCPPLKALDFLLNDAGKIDLDNSKALLQKEKFPSTFTICTAFMVESWSHHFASNFFLLCSRNTFSCFDDKDGWLWVGLVVYETHTDYIFQFDDTPMFETQSDILFYPLQWTQVCLSLNTSAVKLVVDGKLLKETKWERKKNFTTVQLGVTEEGEQPGRITDLNIFSSALTVEQMMSQTSPGDADCGLQGDFLSWEKSWNKNWWTLRSKAEWIDLDSQLESPCRKEPTLNLFPMIEDHLHSDCMELCNKLGGRSPSVRTEKEWKHLFKEVKTITPDTSMVPMVWLSATQGDIGFKMSTLDHWPERVKAVDGVWRDY